MASDAAAALAAMPTVYRALLAAHVPDDQGRCTSCRWQTRSADRWPCNVYSVAKAAQLLSAGSAGGDDPGRRHP